MFVCVCVSMWERTASISCPASRLITEIFGFSLQQAARFQPVRACHLSPHSPLWPRTQPPIWGDSSSLLSHTHKHAPLSALYARKHTQSTLNAPPRVVDLSGRRIKINNILHMCLVLDFVRFVLFTIVCKCVFFGFHPQHLGTPGARSGEGSAST